MRLFLVTSLWFALPLFASSLQVEVTRNGFAGPIEIALAPRVEGQLPKWSASKTMAAGESTIRFSDLGPGLYIVLARGPEPLQRLGVKANVGKANQVVKLVLPRTTTALQVNLAREPIARATVQLFEEELRWDTQLSTDEGGRFAGPLWQAGTYDARVRREPTSGAHVTSVHLGTNPITIDVPDRHIGGRIVGDDGAPVANAQIALRTKDEQSTLMVLTRSTPDGHYEFFGVREGTHSLVAHAPSYLQSDLAAFDLRGTPVNRTVDLTLSRGVQRSVHVTNQRGAPFANASIFGACDGHMKSMATTNGEGSASIALPRTGSCAVYAVPSEGSIGVTLLNATGVASGAPVLVRVPDGSGSLDLALQSDKGDVFADTWLLMSIDGVVVPPGVGRQLITRGLTLVTDADGRVSLPHIPPGSYEFWPYRNEAEGQMLYEMTSSFAAPISVNVKNGENTATVKFKARK